MTASVSLHPVGAAFAPRASAPDAAASAACDLVRLSTCEPGSNIPEALATAGAGIRDWDSVIALAVRHRVTAYLQAANRRAEGARGARSWRRTPSTPCAPT